MTKLNIEGLEEPYSPYKVLYENDSVYQLKDDGKWYYWDEAYLENGPFDTEHEARIDLVMYCWHCLENRQWGILDEKYRRISFPFIC